MNRFIPTYYALASLAITCWAAAFTHSPVSGSQAKAGYVNRSAICAARHGNAATYTVHVWLRSGECVEARLWWMQGTRRDAHGQT